MALNPFSWRNTDGLGVWLGASEGKSGAGGEQRTLGDQRVLTQVLNLADLTNTSQYIDQHIELPKNAFIEKVEIFTLVVAGSSGSGTLNIGLKGSDQVTNVSDTALASAVTTATMAAGALTTIIVGSSFVGSSVGTALTVNGLLTAKWATAVFQSGKVEIRVFYNFVA